MPHSHLLAPGRIGSMTLRNRILMCPMGDNQATSGGYVTEQQIAYFEARARGGAALLLVGSVGVTAPEGLSSPRQSAIGQDDFVEGWQRLAARVHAHGAKVALQLVHNGKNAVEDIIAARPLLVPSMPDKPPAADPLMGMLTPEEAANIGTPGQVEGAAVIFHEMSKDDISRMVDAYSDAVLRAREAGIDGVELHAGHGYLIDNFLSPTTNHRTDEYGGPVDRRARFLVEILEAIRARVGPDYPVWCRLNGEEYLVDGETTEDACRVAVLAERAGADAVHISAYADPSRAIGFTEAHATHTPGRFLPLAATVKAHVEIPVIAVGRLSPDAADQAIAEGQADFVAMGRKLLADPELPNKLAAGEPESVRPCMYHYRCISQIFVRGSVRCAVNALTGFEADRRIEPASRAKRVLVVGGGPAGMEAARLGALRGHSVVLAEAGPRLGGRFALAARTQEANADLLRWLEGEIARRGIEVRLDTPIDARSPDAEAFDEVVVATGARWPLPDVPREAHPGLIAVDALGPWLEDERTAEGRQIVVLGGNRAGLSLAMCARARGAEVVVLEPSEVFGASLGLVGRWRHVHEAIQAGVDLEGGARLESIEVDSIRWRDTQDRPQRTHADTILVSSGAKPDTGLSEALAARGVRAHSIGDCQAIGLVEGAMQDAAKLMLEL